MNMEVGGSEEKAAEKQKRKRIVKDKNVGE